LSDFSFGIIYEENGSPSSEYFQTFDALGYPVQFTINFQGLGLPKDNYNQYTVLLRDVVGDAPSCSTTEDGGCTLPSSCDSYSSELGSYFFKFTFSSAESGYYMRVPLAAFALATDNNQCSLQVQYVDSQELNSVVLGGMFFQEFFGVFTNDYSKPTAVTQSAQLYTSNNQIYSAYVGNEQLSQGANPFSITDDDTGFGVWVIVGICCGGLALVMLVAALILCCCKRKNNDWDAQAVVYDQTSDQTQNLVN